LAEIVVADAGPLIALGRLRKLDILSGMFEKVIVPQAVFQETQFRPDIADAQAILAARQSGVLTVDASSPAVEGPVREVELGEGEAAAISLAASRGHAVLIDEKLGREVAAALGLRVIGTVGVLLIARRRKLIHSLKPLLDELNASGYHLSEALLREALRQAGE
jgi:predicted nucleic acid-binding protein